MVDCLWYIQRLIFAHAIYPVYTNKQTSSKRQTNIKYAWSVAYTKQIWSKRQSNIEQLEHTSCPCILMFAWCLLDRVNGVIQCWYGVPALNLEAVHCPAVLVVNVAIYTMHLWGSKCHKDTKFQHTTHFSAEFEMYEAHFRRGFALDCLPCSQDP